MKLKLTQEKDVQVLKVSEAISPKDVLILKAGISKLFKNGKNRIVLEISGLPTDGSIPNEVLREIARLDILAREMRGRVVLAGVSREMRIKIELFAVPPIIPTYETLAEAVDSFLNPKPIPNAAPVAATASANAPASASEELREQKAKIAALELENRKLREQLGAMVIAGRQPPDAQAYEAKILELEDQLEQLLTQVKDKKPGT